MKVHVELAAANIDLEGTPIECCEFVLELSRFRPVDVTPYAPSSGPVQGPENMPPPAFPEPVKIPPASRAVRCAQLKGLLKHYNGDGSWTLEKLAGKFCVSHTQILRDLRAIGMKLKDHRGRK